MNALFVADSLGKSFGSRTVLTSATAWAARGTVSALLGRNGSGKSTLLRTALGLHRADYGTVRFGGATYERPRLWRLAGKGLFYLPDRGFLSRTLSFGGHLRLLTRRYRTADPAGIVELLGVASLLDSRAYEMSVGERRRAELALAVTRKPTCLIADEPLTEVEPKDRPLVASVLRHLADGGCAVLVTGHEIHDLLDVSDDVIWMTGGTTHGLGSPAAARAHDQFQLEYLGTGPDLPGGA